MRMLADFRHWLSRNGGVTSISSSSGTLHPAPGTLYAGNPADAPTGSRRQLLVTHLQLNAPKSCEFFTNAQFVCVNTFVGVIELGGRPGDNRAQGMH